MLGFQAIGRIKMPVELPTDDDKCKKYIRAIRFLQYQAPHNTETFAADFFNEQAHWRDKLDRQREGIWKDIQKEKDFADNSRKNANICRVGLMLRLFLIIGFSS